MPNMATVTAPNVFDAEDLYNVIVLGGLSSPGKVTLSGHDRKNTWDVQNGPFLGGARIILKAIPPIEFTATFQLVYDVSQGINDFASWPAFQKMIDSTTAGAAAGGAAIAFRPKALNIYHPDLAAQNPPIQQVVKGTVGGMVYDGKGGATIAVQFQEYRAPRTLGGPAVASKPGPDPNALLKAKVKALTTEYQNTPWG